MRGIFLDAFRRWLYGPEIGQWREIQLRGLKGRLFSDVLVVLIGEDLDKFVLDLGVSIAKLEGSQVLGLYLAPPKKNLEDFRLKHIQDQFEQLCKESKVTGNLAVAFERNSVNHIIRRARFANLAIIPLGGRLISHNKYKSLIMNCQTPLITISRQIKPPMNNILLAYDGSPKSEEALYMAAYLSKFWELSLSVIFVSTSNHTGNIEIIRAKEYLQKFGIEADFVEESGLPSAAVNAYASNQEIDLIIIGGYSTNIIKKIFTGSMVDDIISTSNHNLLICK
jgi:nucleotide-binding universal stress UspA family protein